MRTAYFSLVLLLGYTSVPVLAAPVVRRATASQALQPPPPSLDTPPTTGTSTVADVKTSGVKKSIAQPLSAVSSTSSVVAGSSTATNANTKPSGAGTTATAANDISTEASIQSAATTVAKPDAAAQPVADTKPASAVSMPSSASPKAAFGGLAKPLSAPMKPRGVDTTSSTDNAEASDADPSDVHAAQGETTHSHGEPNYESSVPEPSSSTTMPLPPSQDPAYGVPDSSVPVGALSAPQPPSSPAKHKMSGGAIAGTVIGSVGGAAALGAGTWLSWRKWLRPYLVDKGYLKNMRY